MHPAVLILSAVFIWRAARGIIRAGRCRTGALPKEVLMTRLSIALFTAALLTLGSTVHAQAAPWVAGKHYAVLPQAQRTNVPAGKVEVLEVFSYGCPACNHFLPIMKQIKASLPSNAQMMYLPASWNAAENWPTFQRAYLTASTLGVADKAHDAMFDAIWNTGELAVMDPDDPRKLKSTLPSMEDIARLYQRVTGVKAADFVAASKSFGVDVKVRQADSQIIAMQVSGTPTLVINGKYRINNENLRGSDDFIQLVKFLVAKETAATAPAAPAKKAS
jgi:protein dithiol oxidoreductase (disulfide-forming)